MEAWQAAHEKWSCACCHLVARDAELPSRIIAHRVNDPVRHVHAGTQSAGRTRDEQGMRGTTRHLMHPMKSQSLHQARAIVCRSATLSVRIASPSKRLATRRHRGGMITTGADMANLAPGRQRRRARRQKRDRLANAPSNPSSKSKLAVCTTSPYEYSAARIESDTVMVSTCHLHDAGAAQYGDGAWRGPRLVVPESKRPETSLPE